MYCSVIFLSSLRHCHEITQKLSSAASMAFHQNPRKYAVYKVLIRHHPPLSLPCGERHKKSRIVLISIQSGSISLIHLLLLSLRFHTTAGLQFPRPASDLLLRLASGLQLLRPLDRGLHRVHDNAAECALLQNLHARNRRAGRRCHHILQLRGDFAGVQHQL